MSDPLLTLQDVTVQFGGVRACDQISVEIERGELFALIGPNGAGKTTLVNSVTGIYQPLDGAAVRLDRRSGESVDLLSLRPYQIARSGVARTFQNLGLFPSETVLTNLMLGRYTHQDTGLISGGLFTKRAVQQELETRDEVVKIVIPMSLGDP